VRFVRAFSAVYRSRAHSTPIATVIRGKFSAASRWRIISIVSRGFVMALTLGRRPAHER
jgi:hypothetical protein